jgi:tetratricopeptide (TPR) repeat protein
MQAGAAARAGPRAPGFAEVPAMIMAGRRTDTIAVLRGLTAPSNLPPRDLAQAAQFFTQLAAHDDALACHRRLHRLVPHHPDVLQGLAGAEIACGSLEDAEAHLDQAIDADPAACDAWYNRAVLRRQTPARNHVDALRRALAGPLGGGRGAIPLCYALAKELEDLGEHSESFVWLQRGAAGRRAILSYRVAADVHAMAEIETVFSAHAVSRAVPGVSTARPIFIIGLPRTGTTLLERMLGMHSQVTALGELTDLPLAVTRAAAGANKSETIRRAGEADFARFGRDYLRSVAAYGAATPVTTDKLPSNFLYVGMLRMALPQARIIHLRRAPMDTAYAIYKTLFRMGYPYSYDLSDLAAYYAAYDRLMRHWHHAAPGYVIDVAYEDLVTEPQRTARALFGRLDLPWEQTCLDFHRQGGPVATASAAQVREPVHDRSVGLWRHHAAGLEPFATALRTLTGGRCDARPR